MLQSARTDPEQQRAVFRETVLGMGVTVVGIGVTPSKAPRLPSEDLGRYDRI